MSTTLPSISIIIPTFNEEGFVIDCLNSLLHGNYPTGKIEIIVVDGGSTDQTCRFVSEYSTKHATISLIHNRKKIVPAALNIGIANSKHKIIVWAGAHAIYDQNFLVYSVILLLEKNCASVGGIIYPVGKTLVGKTIALATTSKFGIGNAKYRHATHQQSVDTVFGGCWKKENILKIGGFDERWVRNQDFELNYRLRAKIGEIILDPAIRCQYFCRESISSLARQYFSYGYWRFHTFLKHPRSFTFRQAAPLLLLTGLSISSVLLFYNVLLASILPTTYTAFVAITSVRISISQQKLVYLPLLPVVFVSLHLSWASGFGYSAIKHLINKIIKNRKENP